MRRWLLIIILLLIVVPALALGAWVWAALKFSYSSGERIGYVQKLSNKGWLCKTWEGELTMTTQPGVAPQVFPFSVRDDAVARRLHDTNGQRVRLTYEQHRFLPTTCFGETEYFVTGVTAVEEKRQ
jgi:hypothetical protein